MRGCRPCVSMDCLTSHAIAGSLEIGAARRPIEQATSIVASVTDTTEISIADRNSRRNGSLKDPTTNASNPSRSARTALSSTGSSIDGARTRSTALPSATFRDRRPRGIPRTSTRCPGSRTFIA